MDDAVLVRGLERVSDLTRDRQNVGERQRTSLEQIGKRRAFDELQHQRLHVATCTRRRGVADHALFEAVDGADVRVVDRCKDLGFAIEP